MSIQTFIVLVCIALMGMAWYANTSKRNKILVRYRRPNKTLITKFVDMNKKDPKHVIFDKLKFNIVSKCIVFQWYQNGFIHMLFPIFVPTLDFTYKSKYPLDPNTLEPVIMTPELENAIDQEQWAKSYAKHTTPPNTKKVSGLTQYLPWIAIMLVVLVGFWLYNNMAGLSRDMATLYNSFNALPK
jgi:hypothetical protein